MRARQIAGTCALVATAAIGGCLDPVSTRIGEVETVRVALGRAARQLDTIQVRATTPVSAVGVGASGQIVGPIEFTFESSDTTIAIVTPLGSVQGIAPGSATITARAANGREGTARVVVVPATIQYEIPAGPTPGAIAFSTDYARAYVLTGPDSIAVLDALGFTRLGAARIGLPGWRTGATSEAIYVTHPDADSVSILDPSTTRVTTRLFVGARPRGVAASLDRAFIAARSNGTIAVLEGSTVIGRLDVAGEPDELAMTRDGRRLVATVGRDDGWYVMLIDAVGLDTLGSVRVDGTPVGVALGRDGSRVFVLYDDGRVGVFAEPAGQPGRLVGAGEVSAGAGATGIAAKQGGEPFVVVSGEPVTVFHGGTLAPMNEIANGGAGFVAIRPDGIFAFVSVPELGVVRVLAAE